MAQILNTIATGLKTNLPNELGNSPFLINDSLSICDDFYFCINFNYLNEIRFSLGLDIIKQNLSSYKLILFVCDDIVSEQFVNVIHTKIYDLNILNNYINCQINSSFKNHDTLIDNMSYDEILSLCKEYKLVFRISNNTEQDQEQFNLKQGDIVNNFKLVLDTLSNGPYDVKYETIDLLNPNEFTNAEIITLYQQQLNLFGYEGLRCFYPQSILNSEHQMPILCIQHGVGHEHIAYDLYASKLASYGYFVCMLQQETYGGGDTSFGNYHVLGKLRHFKNNITKISAGKFQNNLNFSKISLMGHSQGANKVYTACSEVGITTENDIDINDIMCLILIGPAIGFPNSSAGFRSVAATPESFFRFAKNVPLLVLNSDDDDAVIGVGYDLFSNFGTDSNFRNEKYKKLISYKNIMHGGFINDNYFINYFPSLVDANYDTRFFYNLNSKANSFSYPVSDVLVFLSLCLKDKLKTFYDSVQYYNILNNKIKLRDCSSVFQHTASNNVLLYIDEFNDDGFESTDNVVFKSHFNFNKFIFKTTSARDVYNSVDDFDGVFHKRAGINSGGIRIDYDDDAYIEYKNGDAYNLLNCAFIEIYISQILNGDSSLNNKLDKKHFSLELIDNQRNTCTLSSKICNRGIPAHRPVAISDTNPHSSVCPYPIKFRIEDFITQNYNLNISRITKIILRFGPSYGSATGALAIHKIQATI